MPATKKSFIIIIVIILLTGQFLGEIKVTGKLLILTADGKKSYDAVITITQAEIMIECVKKIFQPFNVFEAPLQAKIKVSTAEIYQIQINKGKKEILLIAKDSLYQRYKHLFHPVWRFVQYMPPEREEREALIFIMNTPVHIGCSEEELIKFINKRSEQSCTNKP